MKKITDYVSRRQLARELGVHNNTLIYWEKKGKLIPRRNPMNNYCLYDREEVRKLLNLERENPQT